MSWHRPLVWTSLLPVGRGFCPAGLRSRAKRCRRRARAVAGRKPRPTGAGSISSGRSSLTGRRRRRRGSCARPTPLRPIQLVQATGLDISASSGAGLLPRRPAQQGHALPAPRAVAGRKPRPTGAGSISSGRSSLTGRRRRRRGSCARPTPLRPIHLVQATGLDISASSGAGLLPRRPAQQGHALPAPRAVAGRKPRPTGAGSISSGRSSLTGRRRRRRGSCARPTPLRPIHLVQATGLDISASSGAGLLPRRPAQQGHALPAPCAVAGRKPRPTGAGSISSGRSSLTARRRRRRGSCARPTPLLPIQLVQATRFAENYRT